jgi:hypothetical protein
MSTMKITGYRIKLSNLTNWDEFLLKESGLPGPRGNIELAQVVADEGDLELFQRYITYGPDIAPTNSPYEFLAFCGALGLGRLLADGDINQLQTLRNLASDPRWRMREAVAMALQRLGDVDMEQLLETMQTWSHGTWLEQRAAVAALCEPRLLADAKYARETLIILDRIMVHLLETIDRRGDDFIAFRKGLGYCWSVAVVSLPDEGKKLMEKWLMNPDKDVQWVMRENLKKNRLLRLDEDWVQRWTKKS